MYVYICICMYIYIYILIYIYIHTGTRKQRKEGMEPPVDTQAIVVATVFYIQIQEMFGFSRATTEKLLLWIFTPSTQSNLFPILICFFLILIRIPFRKPI